MTTMGDTVKKQTEELEIASKELIHKVTGYVEDKCEWTRRKNNEGVAVYQKKSTDFPGMMFKVEGIVNASPELIFKYLAITPTSPRLQWDKRIEGVEQLDVVNPTTKLMRTYTRSELAGVLTARDFVDLITTVETTDYLATFAESVTLEKYPPMADFVRGFNHPSGIFSFRVKDEPDKTKVTCILQPDLRGNVSSLLVDAVMPSSCEEFYRHLRKFVENET